jgi:hypothetical protein
MMFSEMFLSRFLSQDDFPQPATLIIAGVSMEDVRRPGGTTAMKPIIYFTAGKPMVLNKTNGAVIAKLYGRNTDAWAGKPIELYADPGIKMAGEVVGGIRVRAPKAAPKGTNGTSRPLAPPAKMSPAEAHKIIVDGYKTCKTAGRVEEFKAWGEKEGFDFTDLQRDEQSDAYHAAMERIADVRPALP